MLSGLRGGAQLAQNFMVSMEQPSYSLEVSTWASSTCSSKNLQMYCTVAHDPAAAPRPSTPVLTWYACAWREMHMIAVTTQNKGVITNPSNNSVY